MISRDGEVSADDATLVRILRYVSGEGTGDERAATTDWIAMDPARRALERELKEWREAIPDSATWHTEAALASLLSELRHSAARVSPASTKVRPLSTRTAGLASTRWAPNGGSTRTLARLAAMLLLTTGLAFGFRALTAPPGNQQTVRGAEVPRAPREIVAARGTRATVTLDDGSRVVLGPESRLVILPDFGRTTRTVQLDGWAEFAVRKDTMPFIVKARDSETRVVGTRFVVQARESDNEIRVIVAEGRVESRANARSTAVLRPGQLWTLARDGRTGVRDGVSLEHYFGWTEGRLAFEAVPLPEVLAEVARWYNIDLRLEVTALRSKHVTATLPGDSLAEALALLGRTLDVRIEQQGNLVRLLPANR